MTKVSKTQFAVLGMLAIKPMSGYEIKQMMEQSTNHFWRESNGQLYPTLSRLTEDEFVTFEEEMVGEKQRKIYTITKSGMKTLEAWLQNEVEHYPERNELLLKLFFGKNVPVAVSIQHIKNWAEECKDRLAFYHEVANEIEATRGEMPHAIYYLLTVNAGIKSAEAEIVWCEDSIRMLKQYDK
ncbi:MAG: PadR family transcriptional regulator [Coxiellaceae bacterium]|nr:PadR family transcriptional regulator [Coxiellaceae bacterium]